MKKEEYILGVDDAGRGPIVGPMVIAGAMFDKDADAILKKLGVKDSKMLFHPARIRLAKDIQKIAIGYDIVVISPKEIDAAVNSAYNLNKLEAAKMAYVINNLTRGLSKSIKITVYVDCPSVNIFAWTNVLKGFLERDDLILKVEHKCDVNHVECSAASILAKVRREEEVENLKKMYNIDFGSGYPADPVTVNWLKEFGREFQKYGIIRESWQTWKNHEKNEKQKKLF